MYPISELEIQECIIRIPYNIGDAEQEQQDIHRRGQYNAEPPFLIRQARDCPAQIGSAAYDRDDQREQIRPQEISRRTVPEAKAGAAEHLAEPGYGTAHRRGEEKDPAQENKQHGKGDASRFRDQIDQIPQDKPFQNDQHAVV